MARQGKAQHGRHSVARRGLVGRGMAGQGSARQARRGLVGIGGAGLGTARQARQGRVRHGKPRHGKAGIKRKRKMANNNVDWGEFDRKLKELDEFNFGDCETRGQWRNACDRHSYVLSRLFVELAKLRPPEPPAIDSDESIDEGLQVVIIQQGVELSDLRSALSFERAKNSELRMRIDSLQAKIEALKREDKTTAERLRGAILIERDNDRLRNQIKAYERTMTGYQPGAQTKPVNPPKEK